MVGVTEMLVVLAPVFHAYDVAPLPVSVVPLPAHTDTSGPALTMGRALMETTTVSLPVHVLLVVVRI